MPASSSATSERGDERLCGPEDYRSASAPVDEMGAIPPGEPSPPTSGSGRVRYGFARLRPLETVQWLVAYRRIRLGAPLGFWTAAQAAAASIGWFVARLLDGRGP